MLLYLLSWPLYLVSWVLFLVYCLLLLVAFLLVGAAATAAYYFVRQRLYWWLRGVPAHHATPLVGINGPIFQKKRSFTDNTLFHYLLQPGTAYHGTFEFNSPVIVLKDPELIRDVTVKHFDHFTDHQSFVTEAADPIVANNVFMLKGQRWKEVRATLTPSFTGSRMKMLFHLVEDVAKSFTEYFEENKEVAKCFEAKDAFTRYTNDVIATSAFAVKVDSLKDPNNAFYLHGRDAVNFSGFKRFCKFILLRSTPMICRLMKMRFMSADTNAFFENLISETVKMRKEEGIVRPDMIHLLLEASSKENGVEISINDIVGQAFIFFLAGFETVSVAMYFIAYALATHPDVQERLQREIDEQLEEDNGELTYDALAKLKYLDMVISEAVRLYAPVPMTDRICTKEGFTLPPAGVGYQRCKVEVGTVMLIPAAGMQRDPQYFENPETFDPERFSEENKDKINSSAYLPFGSGPRKCIGNRFALMEIKLLFFHVLRKFSIRLDPKTKHPMKFGPGPFKVEIDGGLWLQFEERKKTN